MKTFKNYFSRINTSLKPFLNGLSLFSGILFLGLVSCSNATDSTSSSPTEDKIPPTTPDTPPTVTISTNKSLEIDKTATITFTFSEEVNGFTKDDVEFSSDDFSVNDITIGNFITNNPREYSLDITPKVAGTLKVSIPANSFYDLFSNKNTDSFLNNFSVEEDKTPPSVNINSDTLIEGTSAYLSFIFSEEVNGFTPDDIQFLTNEANGVNAAKGSFVTNSQKTYSLEITPETNGTLYVTIQANSFEDLSANQNNEAYSSNFTVLDSSTTTHTISFKLNGGSFISSQITNLKVVTNTAIEETKLEKILSYPPTGPKPSVQAVTRDIFEWRNTNGTKYDFSTLVSSDLTLEAVWSNSCGKVETFHPTSRDELKNYIDTAIGGNNPTTSLNHIDTSAITDMNNLFAFKNSFNGKIDCWNTANVNNMSYMFNRAYAFNQDIGSWNTANVTAMNNMFAGANAFNQDISSWDVGNVTNMGNMLNAAIAFNQDIRSWDVGNVTNMSSMFADAAAFNQDIRSWDVGNVTNMSSMFADAFAFNQDIGSWNVANVTAMNNMFKNATSFNQQIGSWDTTNVTDTSYMFNGARAFNQDISTWDVSSVKNMSWMFQNALKFNQPIGSWDTTNVTDMNGMFSGASAFDQDISTWDVSSVKNMSWMFQNALKFNQPIGSWDTTNVTDMNGMFSGANAFNRDISSWDVANVNDMSYMFYNAKAFNQNISSWSVNNVTEYDNMFTGSAMANETKKQPSFQ